jgi:hypothetical protein
MKGCFWPGGTTQADDSPFAGKLSAVRPVPEHCDYQLATKRELGVNITEVLVRVVTLGTGLGFAPTAFGRYGFMGNPVWR